MVRLLVLIGLALVSIPDTAAASRRVALVVGAAEYSHAPGLAHTLNDARDVAAALTRLDFEVDLVLNPDRAALENAVRRLGQKSHGADASLFYFSGHALEAQGVNWMLPVSADVKNDDDLRFEALDLAVIIGLIENKARVSLLFLDACREDPFKQRLGISRDMPRAGLAAAHATGSGTFLAFATAPGSVAADGSGDHSPFTAALLKFIETPGLEVRQMMSRVRGEVEALTDSKQIPWDSSSLRGDFFFDPKTTGEKVIQAINGPNPQVDLDALFWESVKNSKNPKDFSAYLLKFPQGVFAEIARNRLAELNVAPPASAPANPKVLEALAALVAPATQKGREDTAAAYQSGGPHKSLAVNLSNGGATWVTGLESERTAEESVLERCEVNHGGPCVLVAIDEDIKYASGDQITPRPMPRVHYAGSFNPERIPYLPADVRRRPDVVGYVAAPNFKAAAYHSIGRIFIVTSAPSQHAAEEQVLTACNNDPSRQNKSGPCYLYAAGTDVVLSRSSRTPITAAVTATDTPVVTPPVVEPVKPAPAVVAAKDAVPLRDAIVAQLERGLPAMTAESRDLTAKTYESAPPHKALVLRPSGGTYRFVGWPSAEGAEQTTLEACQIYYGAPCAVLAIDDVYRADPDGSLVMRDMPLVHYVGPFAADRIPGISPTLRARADVQGYAAAPESKAMALHPWGQIYTITGAANQNDAETRALAACNGDSGRKGQGGPCYLYASANLVLLDKRYRQAIAAPVAVAVPVSPQPPAPAPAPAPNTADDSTLKDSLLQRLTTQTQAAVSLIGGYLNLKSAHRAIAANGSTIVTSLASIQLLAEIFALERCQLIQGAPCALIGSDREVAPASPPPGSKWAARSMPRLGYTGPYDAHMIPAIEDTLRNRADVAGYFSAPWPKAVAINPSGIAVITAAKSQYDAETRALATCGAGCFLYATGNQVVLPQRLSAPRPLGKTIADVFSYIQGSEQGPRTAAQYAKAKEHKAIATVPESARAFSWTGASVLNNAELLALEACGLQYNKACVAVAADDTLRLSDPFGVERHPAPRLAYEGPYRPDMVPLFPAPPNEALEYAKMSEPKAMAIRPSGPKIAIATGATLAEAEARALAQCSVADSPFPCFLYAANQATILPQRRTEAQQ
jgi:hypothetical protein